MTFHPYKMNPNPKYWKDLSEEDFETACVLYKHSRAKSTLLHCHYMLEKILKAILAQQNLLTDEDADHKLLALAMKAFKKDYLSEHEIDFLREATRWHIEASYPTDQYIYDILEDDKLLKCDFEKSCQLYLKFRIFYASSEQKDGDIDE